MTLDSPARTANISAGKGNCLSGFAGYQLEVKTNLTVRHDEEKRQQPWDSPAHSLATFAPKTETYSMLS